MTVPVLLFTRFSILSDHGGFNQRGARYHRVAPFLPGVLRRAYYGMVRPKTREEKRRFLFDPVRLRDRLALFETISLPSLANQTDRDFRHVVLTSSELPTEAADALADLSHRWGFEIEPVDPSARHVAHAQRLARETEGDRVITMRLDDDDALSEDAIARTRRHAALAGDRLVIGTPSGFHLRLPLRRGSPPTAARLFAPSNSQGQALVERRADGALRTVLGIGGHTGVARREPMLSLPDAAAYVAVSHMHNNSNRYTRGRIDGEDPIRLDEVPWARFGLDPAAIRDLGRHSAGRA